MNRPRHAKLVSCEQKRIVVPDMTAEETKQGGRLFWVATDSAHRTFADLSKVAAEKMLTDYNR